jgi:hypothetical protein
MGSRVPDESVSVGVAASPRFSLSEGSRYGLVLVLLVCSVMNAIISSPGVPSALLTAGLEGAAVLVALSRPATSNLLRILLTGGVLISVVLAAVKVGSVMRGLSDLFGAGLILTLPAIIVMRFRRNLYVNVQSVLGAVCIYLVIGIIYANVDSALGHLTGQRFFAEAPRATSSQFMYFSLVTLCTVGYGDLTPQTAGGRALAVSEALTGQLYLVTVIALLVSNFGRSRQPPSPR